MTAQYASKQTKTKSVWCCEYCHSHSSLDDTICSQCKLDRSGCDPLIGQLIHTYTIQRRVEGGLLNIVYQALDERSDKMYALKRIPAQRQLLQEKKRPLQDLIRKWKFFKHPSAPRVTDVFETQEGDLFWVSPWLQGTPLQSILEQRRFGLSFEATLHIMEALCSLLQAYHASGLLHAQLRIEQLFVREYQGRYQLQLSDLGWGSLIGKHFQRTQSEDEGTLRALRYLSPEQLVLDAQKLNERTDIYSAAAICFHILTGRVPYPSRKREELYKSHLYAAPPRLNMVHPNRHFSSELESVIRNAMAKQPQDRYPSIHSFWQALQSIDPELAIQERRQHQSKSEGVHPSALELTQWNVQELSTKPPKDFDIDVEQSFDDELYLGKDATEPRTYIFILCGVVLGGVLWTLL